MRRLWGAGPAALAAVLILLVWALVARQVSPVLLPGPLAVLQAGWSGRGPLLEATLHTGLASALGLGIALLLGLSGAVSFHLSRALELALYPYALVLQTLPVVAVAPLLVVWLGYGTPVAVASAALVAFFPILTSAHLGLRAAPVAQVELFGVLGAGPLQELLHLRVPTALPYLFSGLRTAGGLAVIGAVVGEFVGSNGLPRSLGYQVLYAARTADTALSFAAIGCAAGLALTCFVLVRALERRLVGRWHPSGGSS